MQNLEYLIQLKVLCEGANQNSTRGCDGCNPLEGIDCYVLKCTKITLYARISVLVCFYNNIYIHPFVCPEMAGGGL